MYRSACYPLWVYLVRELIPLVVLIPKVVPLKLFFDHSRLLKSQKGLELEIVNLVTRSLLTRMAQAALHAFFFST